MQINKWTTHGRNPLTHSMEAARLSLRYFGKISLPPLAADGSSASARITVREKTHGTRSSTANNGSVPASSITVASLEEAVRQWDCHVAAGHTAPEPPLHYTRVADARAGGAPAEVPCTIHAEFTVKETVAFMAWVDDFSPLVRRASPFAGGLGDWGHFFMNPIVLHEVNEFVMRNRTWAFYCHYNAEEMSVVIEDGGPIRGGAGEASTRGAAALTWGARRLHLMEMVDSYRRASFKDAASAISFDGGVEALNDAELAAHNSLYARQKPARVVHKALLR
jgi:hypothetical protein